MKQHLEWTVVGAGPAGIAAVGKLIDNGVPAERILWVDPQFKVGDLGQFWSQVSSNTRVKLFTDFLLAVDAFGYNKVASDFSLNTLNPQETCTLMHMVEPLQWVTDKLRRRVQSEQGMVHSMFLKGRVWHLTTDTKAYTSKNVILATGALPSSLSYPGVELIPFDTAIDKDKLAANMNKSDTFAVFGSSHSAVIILRYLVELGAKKIINFYRSPCRYALDMGDWILFDNTGLKGQTAAWAKEHIDGYLPENLHRFNTSEPNIARYLPECNKVIYAVGFEKRRSIVVGDYEALEHNPRVGIIGPGLFGFGIAYPELKTDPFGSEEYQVGLWKFMTYLNRVLPVWFKYSA